MELKKLQSELQRLLTIADRWQRADDITPIERDLMLGRLREIYEALLFGLENAPQESVEQPAIGVAVGVTEPAEQTEQAEQAEQPQQEPTDEEPAPAEQQTEPTEEIAPMEAAQREEEPWFLDADDLLSFDALDATEETSFGEEQPSEEQLEEPIVEEEVEEEVEEAFAPEEEQPSQPIELPIDPLPVVEEPIEEEELIEEELAEAEEQPEELPTAQEEPAEPIEQDQEELVEQEPIEEKQPEPVAEEPAQIEQPATPAEPEQEEPATPAEPEQEQPATPAQPVAPAEPKPIAQPQPVAAQPQQRVSNLFGEEEASVRHRNRQRAILSLYDTHPKELLPKESEVVAVNVKPEVIEISDQELAASKRIVRRTAVQPTKREEVTAPTPAPVQPQEPVSANTAETSPRPVLGEVIKPVETISDTIAPKPDMATQIHRQSAVVDLRRAVGVNDKYLLIRDLFGGNGSLYEITIRRLNEFQTFDECLIYIAKNFSWNPDSDGARLLMDVLERKFAE
ncbi:MAG: hypothetical protein IJN55_06110 [Alistipes sp.]|nr:hypothetical protein [Alistipes sp.]